MAVTNLTLYRGVPIPDCALVYFTADGQGSWSDNMSSTDFEIRAPHPLTGTNSKGASPYGVGRALYVDPATFGASFDYYIESSYTPSGVGSGPTAGSDITPDVWAGFIGRCETDTVNNTRNLVQITVTAYDAAGNAGDSVNLVPTFKGVADAEFTKFGIYTATSAAGLTVRHTDRMYKVRVYFRESSTTATRIAIEWVGLGFGTATSFGTAYLPDVSGSHGNLRRWAKSKRLTQPISHVVGAGAHVQRMSLTMPLLTEVQMANLRVFEQWNAGTPTEQAAMTDGHYAANRGVPSPVVVILDREGLKRAFYADFAGEVNYVQAVPGWYPESGSRWAASMTLDEWLP